MELSTVASFAGIKVEQRLLKQTTAMEFLKAMSDVGVSRAFQWTEE
jgi:hypothetical protein